MATDTSVAAIVGEHRGTTGGNGNWVGDDATGSSISSSGTHDSRSSIHGDIVSGCFRC